MTQEQWRRVQALFERALEEPPPKLADWLEAEAGGDLEVRMEVESLLQHHDVAGRFLDEPAVDSVPALLADAEGLAPGQAVGGYTIVRELGRGGMGRVYLANDERLGRAVALKALPPALTGDSSQRERLRREARAAAALTHPGICTVYALEELDGDLFIVTEYVDGHTLREEIEAGRRPDAREAMDTARQLAAALASAHAKGITHRDLKPENVMRTRDGRLKILDFGLARLEGPAQGGIVNPRMTVTGTLVGTPAYMAPEQLNGRAADARSDVFAFGVLMYEYICGVHPFHAETPFAQIARVLDSEVAPIHRWNGDVAEPLATVISRSLKKSPDDRYRSASELVIGLDAGSPPMAAHRAITWWRTHQLVVIGLYLVASILAWQIKEWTDGPLTSAMFISIGIAATVGGVFRGHLVFTEWMNAAGLRSERRRAAPVTMAADLAMAAALAVGGLVLSSSRELAAVLTLGLAVGIALTRLVLEPSTTRAVFGDNPGP